MSFDSAKYDAHFEKIQQAKEMDKIERKKMLSSRELIKNLQDLFAMMLLSNVKYQDPTRVLECIVDDNGNSISIYEQKDIGEFFLNLLDRLQDGLCENKTLIRKMMGNDFAQNMKTTTNSMDDQTQAITHSYDEDLNLKMDHGINGSLSDVFADDQNP